VLRALVEQGTTISRAAAGITLFPQRLINVRVPKGFDWKANDAIRAAQAGTVAALGDSGRVLLRPSGTEPVLRVMVEARDAQAADRHAQALADVVAAAAAASA
jgi:phosphoglucosamine mutase